jgi:hypothetical protein
MLICLLSQERGEKEKKKFDCLEIRSDRETEWLERGEEKERRQRGKGERREKEKEKKGMREKWENVEDRRQRLRESKKLKAVRR